MTAQTNRARAVRIMALGIVVVALLAATAPSVLVTVWVLLMAVPVLATLGLVRNLLDGAAQTDPARTGRIVTLAIVGVALMAAGVSSVMTLWTSSFGRFMHLEDLGIEGRTGGVLADMTSADRGLFVCGGILALLGAAALIAAGLARLRSRVGR